MACLSCKAGSLLLRIFFAWQGKGGQIETDSQLKIRLPKFGQMYVEIFQTLLFSVF
jgi:hypothetical protein